MHYEAVIGKSLEIVNSHNRGGVEDTRLEAKDTKKSEAKPSPRTAFPRTEPLEAKDRGHRRKRSPKKKVFKNIF